MFVQLDDWAGEIITTLQLCNRPQVEKGRGFQLTEEGVLRASRAVLPIANSMISTAQVIFSGEPLMTLKVRLQFGSVSYNIGRDIVSPNNLGVCDCCNVRYYLFFFSVLNMGV
jgi:hypothetical protein